MPGEILQSFRDRAGLTQTELAFKADVSLSQIQKMEAAQTMRGHRSTWRRVAEALGKGLDAFDAPSQSLPSELMTQLETHARDAGLSIEEFVRAASLAFYVLPEAKRDALIARVTKVHRPGVFPTLAATETGRPKGK